MPINEGLGFLRELREQENKIAFIIFTTRDREEFEDRAYGLGADCCINNSGSPEVVYRELADAIRKSVQRKKATRRVRGQSSAE